MEYLPGISLSSHLKAQPSQHLNEPEAKRLFKHIVESIAYLHESNIAHRDIKLENIIIDSTLTPKIIDFGFATCMNPT